MRLYLPLLLLPIFAHAAHMHAHDHFADNGWGNAVAIVQQPAGEHLNGITYVTYQGLHEDPYVAAYNHNTKTWEGPFQAGASELGKDPNRRKKIDNHGKPAMVIDNEGYIHIVFGGHGGKPEHGKNLLGNHHDGRMKHIVSKRPLDISEWEELDNIPPFGTYNQFVKMDNGDLFLFYRHGAHRSDWVYQKSTDNGRTFDAPVSFLRHQRHTELHAEDSWYAWASRGQGDDIIVAYDYHICWDSDTTQNTNGHIAERHNVFYMVMDTRTGEWRNVEGETLKMPIERIYAETHTLVQKIEDQWTFQCTTKLDSSRNPHISVTVGPYFSGKFSGPKRMQHFKWDGNKWIGEVDDSLPVAKGDFIVESKDTIKFFLASKDGTDGVISWWISSDGGKTFKQERELLRKQDSSFAISSIIHNSQPEARIVVAEIVRNSPERRVYLLGENGAVQRSSDEG